jgi:hypothetical protein
VDALEAGAQLGGEGRGGEETQRQVAGLDQHGGTAHAGNPLLDGGAQPVEDRLQAAAVGHHGEELALERTEPAGRASRLRGRRVR